MHFEISTIYFVSCTGRLRLGSDQDLVQLRVLYILQTHIERLAVSISIHGQDSYDINSPRTRMCLHSLRSQSGMMISSCRCWSNTLQREQKPSPLSWL